MNDAPQELTQQIQQCYQALSNKQSNLVLEVMPKEEAIYQWHHYPKGDVKDKVHHSQYYYHSHPSKDSDRVPEHGHFHIFFQNPVFSEEDPKIVVSQKYLENNGTKDNLTHIIAIAMNELGFPTALFTVNYWVVMGIWRPAETIIKNLDRFLIQNPDSLTALTDQWITAMVQLFKPQIAELLKLRDEVVAEFQAEHPETDVYYNKDLEVTSVLKLVE